MKNKKILKLVLIIAQLIAAVACGVSEEEKEERQINAFDLSGGWMTDSRMGVPSTGIYDGVTLFISNEGNDRSNIKIEVIRDAWSSEEENFVDALPISFGDKQRIKNKYDGTFILGQGQHQDLIGGENISDDFGESSKVYVTTNGREALKTANDVEINYYLDAKINRNDFVLRGSLRMIATKLIEEVDEFGNTSYHFEQLGSKVLNFRATNETAYYQQYFGTWSGKAVTTSYDVEGLNLLTQVRLSQFDDEMFSLSPNISTLYFRGERFELSQSLSGLIELKIVQHPTLDFTFIGSNGSILHFGGSVRSLGHFSGSVEYISDLEIETIGYFDFKRL
jgi:hypothetical protein